MYIVCRKCMATELGKKAPYLFPEVEGHQDEFEVDVDYERRLQKLSIWPKAWEKRYYWEFCEAHKKALFGGFGTRDHVRSHLWPIREGDAILTPGDIRAVGLSMKDFPPFEWSNAKPLPMDRSCRTQENQERR